MSQYAVVICARMSSSRLPGKALLSYLPEHMPPVPNLVVLTDRWRSSRREQTVIVATSSDRSDEPIARLCREADIPCHRGPLDDVLARMDGAVRQFAPEARWVARALADNPLVDVEMADWRLDVLARTGAEGLHYGGDEAKITYAGTTDVWSRRGWEKILAGSSGSQCEHPGVYYWENLSLFSAVQLPLPRREYLRPFRTELDTPDDCALFQAIWAEWLNEESQVPGPESHPPTLWALQYLEAHPEVARLNAHVEVKTQARAVVAKGKPWLCPSCHHRRGEILGGNLIVHCPNCGAPDRFYRSYEPPQRNPYRKGMAPSASGG